MDPMNMKALGWRMHRSEWGVSAGTPANLAAVLVLLVLWMPIIVPVVHGDVAYIPDDTVPKFRMSLGNHGNPRGLFPLDNGTLWVTGTDAPMQSSPVVSDGRVYVGTMGGSVLCLSATSGSVLWTYETGRPIESTPAVDGERVYVGCDDGLLHCLDAATGETIWNATTGGEVKSSPTVWQGLVIVGSNDYGVHCFNATHGAPIWNFSTDGWVYSSPAVWEGRAYIGSCDGRLYCLNATTGVEHWRFKAAFMPASPAVVDGVVVVGAYDERLYAIDALTGMEIWNASVGDGGIYSSAAVGKLVRRDYISAFVGDNGGRLSLVQNGTLSRRWDLGGAVKSSPVYLFNLTDALPRPPPLDAVIVGTETGEVVAVNPSYDAMHAFNGQEYWWRLVLGTSVTASPFTYNDRVYISATDGERGVVACIGELLYGEVAVAIDEPAHGSHMLGQFDVSFHATGVGGETAKVLAGGMTFPATWSQDHWEASVSLGATTGPIKIVAMALATGGRVLAESSVDIVVRSPTGPPPRIIIVSPSKGDRVDPIAIATGRVEGDYPPLRLEASWDGSGCWTAFEPRANWTLALTTSGLRDGHHILHVQAFDGMFTGEASVNVDVGEVRREPVVGLTDIGVIVLLLAVAVVLILTRPDPPPKT